MTNGPDKELAILGGSPEVPDGLVHRWPLILDQDRSAISRALDAEVLWGHAGPEVTALEREWADWVGTGYCLATNNGTAALHLALAGVGVGPGDEVITTAVSWTSTATAILYHNAIPVFADVAPATGNIDPADIERRVSERTKAILPVHLHGLPADMDRILDISRRHGIPVIEDACQAHGAVFRGAKAGSIGDAAAFSVHASKNLPGLGEGGLFVTSDPDIYQRAARVHQFGEVRQPDGLRDFESVAVGWNYRTFEVPAAFVRSQLERLDNTVEVVRENAGRLSENLAGLPGIRTPVEPAGHLQAHWTYTIAVEPEELGLTMETERFRDLIRTALMAEGIVVIHADLALPAMANFQNKTGYGRGSPWTDGHTATDVSYDLDQYPVAIDRVARTISLDGHRPPNGREAMDAYGTAFAKVMGGMEQLIEESDRVPTASMFGERPKTTTNEG